MDSKDDYFSITTPVSNEYTDKAVQETVRKNTEAPTVVSRDKVKITASKAKTKGLSDTMTPANMPDTFFCTTCGRSFKRRDMHFYESFSPLYEANSNYITVCKDCIDKYYNSLVTFYTGSEEKAIERICQLFDIYYSEKILAAAMQANQDKSLISVYMSKVGQTKSKEQGTSYLQTIRDRAANFNPITGEVKVVSDEVGKNSDAFLVTDTMMNRWGLGYTYDEYQFLETEYADWCAKNVCNTKSQEEIYKNIAIAQIIIRRAQKSGKIKDIADAQKNLQDLMNSAAILPKQNSDNPIADTQTFGTLVKKYEETRPIPEAKEEWKDVDGIRKYINTWFKGGLAKALKIKNDNTALYDEALAEYEKYTVTPPKMNMIEESIAASLFDQNKDKDDSSNERPGDAE